MSKIFLSHSSADNAAALALSRWLEDEGWGDHFLDITPMRGLAPGARWQEELKKAAHRCQVVLFLISPAWRDSQQCLAEFLLAKYLGKALFGVIIKPTPLESLAKEMTAEWQLCDLTSGTQRRSFRVYRDGLVPETEVSYAEVGLASLKLGLQKAGLDPSTFPWPSPQDPDRVPYRGLKALEAEDAAIFFGRDADILRGLDALRKIRDVDTAGILVILGASGSGKSSFLRAGLWPRLARDDRHFLPLPVIRPEVAAITGKTGLVSSLEAAFRQRGAQRNRADIHKHLQQPEGLAQLVRALQQPAIPALPPDVSAPTVIIPIDQGEELFTSEGRAEAEQFLTHLGGLLASPKGAEADKPPVHPLVVALVAIRSDSYARLQVEGCLQQVNQTLFDLKPISRVEYKGIIEAPAQRATAAGRRLAIEPRLTKQLIDEAEGADALPLLAFILERLFEEYGADGDLTLDEYKSLGGVQGAIEAAIAAAFAHPERPPTIPTAEEDRLQALREAFPLLAVVDPDNEERKRRIARWEDIPSASQPLIERLVGARLLLKDQRTVMRFHPNTTTVEIAHEALLRQWKPLVIWLDQEAANLKAVEAVKRAAAEWARKKSPAWLLHAGERLEEAESLARRPDLAPLFSEEAKDYVKACREREDAARAEREAALQRELDLQKARTEAAEQAQKAAEDAQQAEIARAQEAERAREAEAQRAEAAEKARRRQWYLTLALLVLCLGGVVWWNQDYFYDQYRWYTTVKPYFQEFFEPYVLMPKFEKNLRPFETFKECSESTHCPTMVVLPSGEFDMGTSDAELEALRAKYPNREKLGEDERPQRKVQIAAFAMARYEVTFEEWEVCIKWGDCSELSSHIWGKGMRPVISVSWNEAQKYVAWLSKATGKSYRLPTEAEWEYAARAGTKARYSWGDDPGYGNANCNGCSDWDSQTAPVGSFSPNSFGLHDMHGNVREWVQDIWHKDYSGTPPTNGAAWLEGGNPELRVIRGGGWFMDPEFSRSANRAKQRPESRITFVGFRIAKSLAYYN